MNRITSLAKVSAWGYAYLDRIRADITNEAVFSGDKYLFQISVLQELMDLVDKCNTDWEPSDE